PNRRAPLTFAEIVPDLIVEVVSPGDTASEVQQKLEEWVRAGARLVWACYPDTHTIAVLRDLGAVRLLREGDTLDAEPVLPGFSVSVAELFAEL
ncbi:MAG: Uma2 family endonuclease, partial [Dehalococcoidia bacterium]